MGQRPYFGLFLMLPTSFGEKDSWPVIKEFPVLQGSASFFILSWLAIGPFFHTSLRSSFFEKEINSSIILIVFPDLLFAFWASAMHRGKKVEVPV